MVPMAAVPSIRCTTPAHTISQPGRVGSTHRVMARPGPLPRRTVVRAGRRARKTEAEERQMVNFHMFVINLTIGAPGMAVGDELLRPGPRAAACDRRFGGPRATFLPGLGGVEALVQEDVTVSEGQGGCRRSTRRCARAAGRRRPSSPCARSSRSWSEPTQSRRPPCPSPAVRGRTMPISGPTSAVPTCAATSPGRADWGRRRPAGPEVAGSTPRWSSPTSPASPR